MIIKTAVMKSEETDNQSNSQQFQSGHSVVISTESAQESKYHCLQMNQSCYAESKSCDGSRVLDSQTDNSSEKAGSDGCHSKTKVNDTAFDGIIEDIINAEILHNLCTKLTGFPVDSYSCKNCGEMFLSKSGCNQHLNRKSVHIVHFCSDCETSIEFFNRCEFLLHVKNHGIIPSSEYLKKTTEFKVIAETKYLNFDYGERNEDNQYYNESVENIEDFGSSAFREDKISSAQDDIAAPHLHIEDRGKNGHLIIVQHTPIVTQKLQLPCNDNNNHVNNPYYDQLKSDYWCSSCGNEYSSPEEFFQHVEEKETAGAAAKTLYHCNIDYIPSYSHCKYVLHNRVIHGKYGPFVCPECGKCFDCWMNLYDHSKCECFHLSQSVLYSCVIQNCSQNVGAKELYTNSTDLLKHYEKDHFRYVLQCIYCTRAFATYEWLFKHLLTDGHSVALSDTAIKHISNILDENEPTVPTDAETLTQNYSKKLIQCLICNVVFCNDLSYNQHFAVKFSDHSESRIVFTCEVCSQQFDKKTAFREHLLKNSTCNNKLKEQDHSETDNTPNDSDAICNNNNKINSPSEKGCKNSSRTYRPRPKPLRIQPARAVATTAIANVPNPNYVLSTAVNIKNGTFLRSHIPQQCHYCRKTFDLSVIKKHESSCSKLQLDPGYCLACKQNYQGSLLLWYHGKSHLKNGLKICLFCNNREVKFDGQMSKDGVTDCDVLEDHLYTFHVLNAKLPYKCMLCKDAIPVKEEVYIHLKKHHNLATVDSFQVKRSRSFQISQLPRPNLKAKINSTGKPQLLSSLKRDSSVTSNHERDGKCGKKKVCYETPESKSSDLNYLTESNNNGDQVTANEHDLTDQLTNVEKYNASQSDTKPIPFVPLVTKTQNARENGTFNCFKCSDFSADTEDEFCDHIRFAHVLSDQEEERHYNGGIGVFPVEFRDFWCPECDISFVVKPSLVKHLQFSHNYIENVDEYMKKVGYDSKRPLKLHQCEICYLRCSDSTDQYNHMKSHGMAFLRLRQQRKTSD